MRQLLETGTDEKSVERELDELERRVSGSTCSTARRAGGRGGEGEGRSPKESESRSTDAPSSQTMPTPECSAMCGIRTGSARACPPRSASTEKQQQQQTDIHDSL